MHPGAQPPAATRLPRNQEPSCSAQAEAALLGAPWTHLRDKARFLGQPLDLLSQSLVLPARPPRSRAELCGGAEHLVSGAALSALLVPDPQLALSPSGPQLPLEGLSQHRLRVCPSDGLLLVGTPACSPAS